MTPTPTAIPAETARPPLEGPALSVEEAHAEYHLSTSVAGAEGPYLPGAGEVVEEVRLVESMEGGAASSASKGDVHPLGDVPLADLADGEPPKEDVLRKEAESLEHLMTHYPKNPFVGSVI